MIKKLVIYFSLFSSIFFYFDHHTIASETPPTVQEILDPSKPWGLNLDLVDRRQKILRKQGDANDVSTKIMLYRKNKSLMAEKINNRITLEKKSQEIQDTAKAQLKSINALNLIAKNNITKKRDQELKIIKQQIDEINSSLTQYKDIVSKLVNNIIQLTGLQPEKVAKIPPKEKIR